MAGALAITMARPLAITVASPLPRNGQAASQMIVNKIYLIHFGRVRNLAERLLISLWSIRMSVRMKQLPCR
jgi:hypothetical protein